ncbi:hypothetical protein SMKI_04G2390 [Saccharomyces mikatae IFO 1815]|uniref:Rad61 Wapl domain-containing protein n=1 Tax=Saccharomyces mikatae IFO 1815 TaxID=226126 RepID=A0AA35IVW8_SACMI|nr:uncharacterized protein SMKI_04G2390 [Saccharomyces mikatae IFO 1815]CAI4037903.1 hypothetical protein SMKI_04G2390 [Saccharomyces mikatae IFO 1815]
MRAYGKRGPVFRSSFMSNRRSSSSFSVEFSDDDVNSIIPDISCTISSSISDNPIEELMDEQAIAGDDAPSLDSINGEVLSPPNLKEKNSNVRLINSGDTSEAFMRKEKLSAFDFLDGSKTSKRKRRRTYQRHDINVSSSIESNIQDEDNILLQNESETIKQIYNDINEFILNLPKADEDVLNKMFENEVKKDNDEEDDNTRTSKDKKYGKFRTILLNKNKAEEIVEEEEEQGINAVSISNAHSGNAEKEGLTSTNHYNELKNMGDTIKYQDDIEFFLSNHKNNHNDKFLINDHFKKLLNLSLMIINDGGFFQYSKRYFKKEIISLTFVQIQSDFPELMLLQGYLLYKLSESECDFPPNFESFSIELSRNESKVWKRNKNINKLSYLNFEYFLQKTQFRTGLYYSLSLWEMHRKLSMDITRRISILASNKDLFSQHVIAFIHLLEKMITDFNFGHTYFKHPDMLDGMIRNLNNQFKDMVGNNSLVKILILLTNMEGHDYSLWKDVNMIFKDSMNTILKSIYPLINAKVDNVLLHLGLCLNICGREDRGLKVDDEVWHNMKAVFLKMIRKSSEVENRLTQGLFYLNFAFVVNQRREHICLNPKDLNTLLVELEVFKSETSQFNEGISNKIEIALCYLKSIYKKENGTS